MVDEKIQVDSIVSVNEDALISAKNSNFSAEGPFTVLTVKRRSDLILVSNGSGETHWFAADAIDSIDGFIEPGTAAKKTGRPRKGSSEE